MLKIKDNVDLEKLREYKFVKIFPYSSNTYFYYRYILDSDCTIDINTSRYISIFIEDSNVELINLDIIYTLIQDGLVEKVEG